MSGCAKLTKTGKQITAELEKKEGSLCWLFTLTK